MSTSNEETNVVQSPIFDPFPEPNTMPAGWDLSGLVSVPEPVTTVPAKNATDD